MHNLSAEQTKKLNHFLERVRTAGPALVSMQDRARLKERHLEPSLAALEFLPESARMMDIGSGGGFPAIPLAIARPSLYIVCVESNNRKASFLQRVSRETELKNLEILNLRVEDLPIEHEKQYDFITARAFGAIEDIVTVSRRFLNPTGKWLLWKQRDWRSEVDLFSIGINLLDERMLSDGGKLLLLENTK